MQKNISASRLSIGICILLAATVLINVCFAQDEGEPQQPYSFGFIQVKPGMGLEFEKLIKDSIPDLKEMGLTQMDVWKTSNFGVSDKYLFVSPLQEPEVMDAGLAAAQTSVPVGLVLAMSSLQRTTVSIRDLMVMPQSDLTIPPEEGYEWKLGLMITIGIAPGREDDFKKGIKEVLALAGKTDVKGVLTSKVGLGGNVNEYLITVLHDSFTDMAKNRVAMGQELAAAELTPQTGVVYYQQNEVFVRLPELCIEPAAQ